MRIIILLIILLAGCASEYKIPTYEEIEKKMSSTREPYDIYKDTNISSSMTT